MIFRQFSVLFKSEYQDLSLCSFNHKMHGPLACPYKTENRTVKRQPEQTIRISRPLVLYEAGGLFVYAGRCQPALTPVLKTVGSSNAVGIDTSVRRHME